MPLSVRDLDIDLGEHEQCKVRVDIYCRDVSGDEEY
jgi:hypothetical protein